MSEYETIQSKIAELQENAAKLIREEKSQALAAIITNMNVYGITVDDIDVEVGRKLSGPKKSGNPAPVKYRGPNGETWAGRGLTPKWLTSQITDGHSREDFLVGAVAA